VIYLDHAATTPLRPGVLEAMLPYLEGLQGNPSSSHLPGRRARRALEGARDRTAALLGRHPEEVFFVRGGTESVALALRGAFLAVRSAGVSHPWIYHSAIEHASVRETAAALGGEGAQVRELAIREGMVMDLGTVPEGAILSCQWVNSETGIRLPIREIAEAMVERRVLLHVDAIQGVRELGEGPDAPPIPLLSLSGHKFGGPRSTAILLARRGTPLLPLLHGGGQERGLRPGTEDLAGAVGFAEALAQALGSRPDEHSRLLTMRDGLEASLCAALPELRVLGTSAPRAAHILGVALPGLPRDLLLGALDLEGFALSAGSACRSGSVETSPTLRTLLGAEADHWAPLRISLGWNTHPGELDALARILPSVAERIRDAGVAR